MNTFALSLIVSYLLVSFYFFINWLTFYVRHPSSCPGDKFLSFLMFLLTTIFWPLVVPMSCVESLKKRRLDFNTAVPVLAVLFGLSLAFYLS